MPTRARVCAWIALCGLVVPSLVAAQDRTEREVVDLIVRDGPQARAIRAETEVTRREQLARLVYPNPGVMYSREGAGFTEFLQIEQSLPIFGVRAALSRAGVAATAAAEAERDARLWRLRADASTAVARLIAEQDRLLAAGSHAREVERLIDVLRTREQEGEGSRFDRLRAEQELRDVRQSVTSAAVAVAEARAAVSAMLPRDTALGRVAGAPSQPPTPPQLEALLARATSARAELRALQRSGDRADREAEAARRARRPAPMVFGGVKRADDVSGRERGGVFGLNVSLPLFDTGGREAARWTAERARVDLERAAVEEQIRAEITRASAALALRQGAVSQDQAPAADELMGIAEVAYREGEVGILELLDAVRTSSRARIRSIEIRWDARLAEIALERAVGDVLWP
ncbi:MAG: TolC family protein [Acidobacteria bacterium]|nr:TolC family protein [Acidobacteriota bacterium]